MAQTSRQIIRATPRDTLWMTEDSVLHFSMIVCSFQEDRSGRSTPAFKLERKNLKTGDIIILPDLRFDADKADIKGEMLPRLRQLLVFLKANPGLLIEIGGHTNNNPSSAYADELSERRAKAVTDWLVAQGIPQQCVRHQGYGKKCPVADNHTAEGRQQNQRVEMTVLKMTP